MAMAMAALKSTSVSAASSSSPSSSLPASYPRADHDDQINDHRPDHDSIHDEITDAVADAVPVETLVEHLLDAKRALSSMTLVLHANSLTTHARHLHEESVILDAQTAFLKNAIRDQAKLLQRVLESMIHTYNAGKRELRTLLKAMDDAGAKLGKTTRMLKLTTVDPVFRPDGEQEPKNLMDFVDENQEKGLNDALFASVGELQTISTSYGRDAFSLERELSDLHDTLKKASSPSPHRSPADSSSQRNPQRASILDLLDSMTEKSHSMATDLSALTQHFDVCVTAVRVTEGGAALARRKAAEDSGEENPVSISGVIAEQEANVEGHDPLTKTEVVKVVLRDAMDVDGIVAAMNEEFQGIEVEYSFLKDQADQVKAAHGAVISAFRLLDDIGLRLSGYIAAETEFIQRWEDEKAGIFIRLEEMENLREFYDGYAGAYDSLILEVERRRAVEGRIQGIWRKAKESVDKLVEADWQDRETFRAEVGEYIPTDLWVGMSGPLRRWDVVRARDRDRDHGGGGGLALAGSSTLSAGGAAVSGEMPRQEAGSAATLDRDLVEATRERAQRGR